jgi:hypothetical protein
MAFSFCKIEELKQVKVFAQMFWVRETTLDFFAAQKICSLLKK